MAEAKLPRKTRSEWGRMVPLKPHDVVGSRPLLVALLSVETPPMAVSPFGRKPVAKAEKFSRYSPVNAPMGTIVADATPATASVTDAAKMCRASTTRNPHAEGSSLLITKVEFTLAISRNKGSPGLGVEWMCRLFRLYGLGRGRAMLARVGACRWVVRVGRRRIGVECARLHSRPAGVACHRPVLHPRTMPP